MQGVKAAVFDLDGTIYLGNSLIDGAVELVNFLESRDVRVFYCTNNSTKTRDDLCRKLIGMGLSASCEIIYSAAHAASRFVAGQGINEAFCLGAQGLREELRLAGVNPVPLDEGVETMVVGLDAAIDYAQIPELLNLRGREIKLIACNRDRFFPADNGHLMPGCGFIVSMVEETIGKKVDQCVGKPSTYMLDLLRREHRLTKDEVLVIGDSLESDIAMANATGCRSIYISTSVEATHAPLSVSTLRDIRCLFDR